MDQKKSNEFFLNEQLNHLTDENEKLRQQLAVAKLERCEWMFSHGMLKTRIGYWVDQLKAVVDNLGDSTAKEVLLRRIRKMNEVTELIPHEEFDVRNDHARF